MSLLHVTVQLLLAAKHAKSPPVSQGSTDGTGALDLFIRA